LSLKDVKSYSAFTQVIFVCISIILLPPRSHCPKHRRRRSLPVTPPQYHRHAPPMSPSATTSPSPFTTSPPSPFSAGNTISHV
jgi:hypothetical protein